MLYQAITWTVQSGNQIGRTLWFPTANVDIWNTEVQPGTYKCNIIIWQDIYTWIGSYKTDAKIFEVHIFNFSEDIYNQEITLIPIYFLRENQKFDTLEDLKHQIETDKKNALKKSIGIMTFWTFDTVHPWHEYYLSEAKKYWDTLTTIVATDENVEKFKNALPHFPLEKRIADITQLDIADKVVPGSNDAPLSWLTEYQPDIICLWYDQVWFIDILQSYITEEWIDIHIIRIPPYKENTYKSSLLKKK